MTQFYSRIDTEFHGDVYSIPFSYINKEEIEVYLDDVLFVDWEFLNESQIKFKNLPSEASNPTMVSIRRNTDISEKIVEYTNNTLLNKENLNLSQDQLLYAVQEIYDNNIQNNINIKAEVDEKVEQVSDAVEKLEILNEAVDTAVLAADTATKQVETITETVSEIENLVIQSEQLITEITQEGQKQIDNIESTGFYMRDDKLYFINSEGVETEFESGGGSGFNLFDTKISDHILEGEEALGWALQGTYVYKEGVAGSRTGYADFYAKCLAEKELGTATETTLGDNTITMYVNGNGHKFYDIADKDVVDTWYNTYGIADYYGIDLVNERIFLPRNKYFAVTGGVKGNGMTLGLTDGTNNYGLKYGGSDDATNRQLQASSNAYGEAIGGVSTLPDKNTLRTIGITTDPTKSGITLEPNESKYLYYCVGNTKVESAVSNVTEITTSENDTLPLFYNFYSQEDMTTTGAYVNASLGSWLSGNVYTTAYNELVNKLGTDNVKANTDTYTDYDFVVNQDDMTFRLPLLNGDENKVDWNTAINLSSYSSSTNIYTVPQDGVVYFRTTLADDKILYIHIDDLYYNFFGRTGAGTDDSADSGQLAVNKGQKIYYRLEGGDVVINFYPYKGNGNLYYKLANAVTNLELLDVAKVTADLNTCYKKNDSDNSILSGLSTPSNKYIDLTLNASGSSYTAPANGYFILSKISNGTNQYITMGVGNLQITNYCPQSGRWFQMVTPLVQKGQSCYVAYDLGGTTNWFRFYYAQGEV